MKSNTMEQATRRSDSSRRHRKHNDDSSHSPSNRRSRSRSSSRGGRKHKKHKKYRRHRERSLSTSSSSSRRRSHKKKSKKKKSRRRDNRSPDRDKSDAPPGAHQLASSLCNLFTSYPAMSSLNEGGIPLIFVQLGNGTEYNLSSMPDRHLASLLSSVFDSLTVHGMEIRNECWCWLPDVRSRDELALVRLVRALLSAVGVSLDTFQDRRSKQQSIQMQEQEIQQQQQQQQEEEEKIPQEPIDVAHQKRVERMTSQLLSRFDPKNSSTSTLAGELQGICNLLLEGESVQLDGLENDKLKASLVQLFDLTGLELVEMDDTTVDSDASEVTKSYGYALPDASRAKISSNLNVVLRMCQFKSTHGAEGAPISWTTSQNNVQDDSSSADEDSGPAPIGTIAAARAAKRAKHVPPIPDQSSNKDTTDTGREEWMMTPGQHDFLKGIQSKSLQSRTFKNERNRGQTLQTSKNNEEINPQVLAEVAAIQQAYTESRGPSLLDAHRQQQQEIKDQNIKTKEWKWNREKNLDDGRRVDKNALHLVLGGAKTELASKFQGSLGR